MSCLQSLKIHNDKSEIQETFPLLFLQISHLRSLSHHPYMPNVDVSVVVIDLRAPWCLLKEAGKGEGNEWQGLSSPVTYSEYRGDPHLSEGSAIGKVGAWCMLLTARETVFSFLRSRGSSGNFFVWRCSWLKLYVNAVFSWAPSISAFPIKIRLHHQQVIKF